MMVIGERIKPLFWVGTSKKDLRAMPALIVDVFGFALHLAQTGDRHMRARPLKGFGGAGVWEVVGDFMGNTYRVVYTTRLRDSVYVLHCFQKKSSTGIETPKLHMDRVVARMKLAIVQAGGQT